MSSGGFRDRIWRSVEGAIDPFSDTDREVLPADAWRFILYFANQAKGAFLLLLITGGLAGAVDAAMYWSVGWLIDLLDKSSPATLLADHWQALGGLEYPVSQDMTLFTEYRYQNAHDANIGALRGVGNTSNSLSVGMKFSL